MARKPFVPPEKRDEFFTIRASPEERELFTAAAAKLGLHTSQWARMVLRAAIEKKQKKTA